GRACRWRLCSGRDRRQRHPSPGGGDAGTLRRRGRPRPGGREWPCRRPTRRGARLVSAEAPTLVSERLTHQLGVPVLELEEVTKSYGGEPPIAALQGVSFSVDSGE